MYKDGKHAWNRMSKYDISWRKYAIMYEKEMVLKQAFDTP